MGIYGRGRWAIPIALLALSALAGCSGAPVADPLPMPTTAAPAPTPIFTSDAEALAAAVAVYRNFLKLSDDVGHDGGTDPERVGRYAGPAVVATEKQQALKLAAVGGRSYGDTKVSTAKLQRADHDATGTNISIYACEDLRNVDVRDANGRSLISADRPDYVAYEVAVASDGSGPLLVISNKFWTGGGVCE